jgi:hypothetical protein
VPIFFLNSSRPSPAEKEQDAGPEEACVPWVFVALAAPGADYFAGRYRRRTKRTKPANAAPINVSVDGSGTGLPSTWTL